MNIPWQGKIVVKSLAGLAPWPYERIRYVLTGNCGPMSSPTYAENLFQKFMPDFQRYGAENEPRGAFLELGPGGSLLSGIYARRAGFSKAVLIDVEDFASRHLDVYRGAVNQLSAEVRDRFFESYASSKDILAAFHHIGVEYLTSGLESLQGISSGTVSFSYSNAVLEHVRQIHFADTLDELFRVHRVDSISSHQIDYKDHLGGGLNHLRFSRNVWESRLFPNQGFYTNRLRHGDMLEVIQDVGFVIESCEPMTWDKLPLSRKKLAREFRSYSDSELLVSGARVVLRKKVPQL